MNSASYTLAILILALSQCLTPRVLAQIQSGNGQISAWNGLGRSTIKCKDNDFDGYGDGPSAILVATSSSPAVPGTNTITLSSVSGSFTGSTTSGSNQITFPAGVYAGSYDFQAGEQISGVGIPNGTIITNPTVLNSQLTISKNATATATNAFTVTVVSGTVMTAGTGNVMEPITISSVASNTITANFVYSHPSGSMFKTAGCAGVDGDDWDGLRWTWGNGSDGQLKQLYGTIAKFMAKRGNDLRIDNPIPGDTATAVAIKNSYASPHAVWYVAPNPAIAPNTIPGSDSNTCTTEASPCLTDDGLVAKGYTSGDMVIARQGWSNAGNSQAFNPQNGTSTLYTSLVSYPGERMKFNVGLSGSASQVNLVGSFHYLIFDGMLLESGGNIGGGTPDGTGSVQTHHILFQSINGGSGGDGLASINMFNGMQYITLQDSILHDNDCPGQSCQHGIYWGCRDIACSFITYRRDIAYGNGSNGFTFNGRCSSCTFTQLVAYSNGVSGLTLEMGVTNSVASDLLLFSNQNSGLTIFNYPGDCPSQGGTGNICPYDETGNLFENITIYQTGNVNTANANGSPSSNCPTGILYCLQAGITVNNTTSPLAGNLGSNTFRNIFVSSYGYVNHYPPIVYGDPQGNFTCDSSCLSWMSTSSFANIIAYETDGTGGTGVLSFGPGSGFGFQPYTCSQAATYTTITNCSSANPLFNSQSISLWNTEVNFDLRLSSTSPLVHAGTATGAPTFDVAGVPFNSTPSIGALEVAPNFTWTNYPSQTTLSVAPPVGGGQYSATATASGGIATLTLSGAYYSAHGNQAISGQNVIVTNCSNSSYNSSSVALTSFTSSTISYAVSGSPGSATGCVVGMSVDGVGDPYDYPGLNYKVIQSWGSAFMSSTGHLIMAGGGHSDYGGNELYQYDMNTNTISRITTPSVITESQFNVNPTLFKNNDGTWATRHILGAWSYMPNVDKLLNYGGGPYGNNGTSGFQDTWLMNPSTGVFTEQDPVNCPTTCSFGVGQYVNFFNPSGGGATVDGYTAYDPNTQTVILDIGHVVLLQYTPCTGSNASTCNSYKMLAGINPTGCSTGQNCQSQFIDDVNKNFWLWGSGVAYYWNIDGSSVTQTIPVIDSSCSAAFNQPAPGIVWDHNNVVARIYAGTGNDQTVYDFNPATLSCTTSKYTGATPPSTTNATGTYGRWQYYAPLQSYVWVGDYNTGASILAPQTGCHIVPSSLPSGTLGSSYSQTLTNVNCSSSTWSLSGSLPAGITGCSSGSGSTCTLSGIATQQGTFNFTVSYSTASDPLSITITPSSTHKIFLPTLIK